jgi:Zn-dependent protease with chaperone function
LDQHYYESLVKRLEVDATVDPGPFRRKVILISSTAYAVMFGVLGALAALLYFGITFSYARHSMVTLIKLGLFAVVMVPVFFVVLRMFFMRLPPPEGRFLQPHEAPKLFDVLRKMRKRLKGPQIHHVVIDDAYNAAIFQRPRWGLFGGHTNYLILGLPYMLSATPKEMLAVVGHEYGHLCGNHGKVTAWIYRQRRTFGALYNQIADSADDNWVHAGMASMLNKFMPYYNAHTFVLSRQNEYEADQTATELVGAAANASGLVRGALLAPWIGEEFWPTLYCQANNAAKPVFLPFNAMRTAFKASYATWATKERLDVAWSEKSDLHDTHPALRERIEAIGEAASLPACVEVTSAEALLGATARTIIDEFDRNWWEKEKPDWTARHQYVTRSKTRLQELNAQALDALKLADLQEHAMLSAEFSKPAAAKVVLEHLLRQPGGPFPLASYRYGCILLEENSDSGLDHLTSAASSDRSLIDAAARTGYAYLYEKHGEDRAQHWWDKIMPSQTE